MSIMLQRLRHGIGRLTARSDGAAAVELALTAPILVLLTFGALDYGGAYVEGVRLNGAAHAGAELALYDTSDWENTDAFEQTALEEYLGRSLTGDERATLPVTAASTTFCGCNDGQTVDCTLTCPGGTSANQFVRLTLSRDVALMLPYPWTDTDTVEVVGEAVVRVR